MIISASSAVEILKRGGLVAVPTETVYGLAADALNPSAIARIFEVKNRPADNPLICHFFGISHVREYVREISLNTEKLMRHFSPGPISLMLDLPADSPLKFATCGSPQVIVRIPDHAVTLEIIRLLRNPVAAPSANTSSRVSPTSAQMVERDLGNKIDGIVDGGKSEVGLESTIVDARSENEIFILRPGKIGKEEIHHVLPDVTITSPRASSNPVPGGRYRHYAPRTPVWEIPSIRIILQEENAAVLLTDEQMEGIPPGEREIFLEQKNHFILLGSLGNLNDLARNFYESLSRVDQLPVAKAFLLKIHWGESSLDKALKNRTEKILSH